MATLTTGDVARLKSSEEFANGVVLRVTDLTEAAGKKYRCAFTDGASTLRGVLASQFADLVASGELANGCLVRVKTYVLNSVGNESVLLATDVAVVAPAPIGSQPMDTDTALTAHNTTPEAAPKPQPGKENSTPGMLSPPTEWVRGPECAEGVVLGRAEAGRWGIEGMCAVQRSSPTCSLRMGMGSGWWGAAGESGCTAR
ncbi:hypothetical protein TSOC_009309 [Tetrabaena socialis]|uniref:Replication factor-A protein 1 N-terminal domain-containing protein n=1 Tax=Tetrabaena socialis TaxID=47790 RepID=A0A2J7ZW68_9CHLO|nr:hypothetical protein TSOC_009309 [Tetrabaena socialis]|eukprot:PNH04517.1 hypothetical protein TSOC_009309 [Tetrabaena socialis]